MSAWRAVAARRGIPTAVVVAGAATALALWPLGASPPFASSGAGVWLEHGVGLGFALAAAAAWARRPGTALGPLMLVVAWGWWAHLLSMSGVPLLFTGSLLAQLVFLPALVYAVLAFPQSRLRSRWSRAAAAACALAWLLDAALVAAFDPRAYGCADCPPNLLLVDSRPALVDAKAQVIQWLVTAGLAIVLATTIARIARGTPVARRVLGPLYVPAALWAVAYGLYIHVPRIGNTDFVAGAKLDQFLLYVFTGALITIPATFLLGVERARGRRARIATLVRELGSMPSLERLEASLSQTLGDPSLRVGLPTPEGFVGTGARALELPKPDDPSRTVARLRADGRVVAVLVHDRALLLDDRELFEAVGAAARLALENEQLQEEVRRQLDHVRASRARLVRAGDDARRQIERNLHDGAQQRLVSLLVGLRLAEIQVDERTDPALRHTLLGLGDQLTAAIDELRQMSRGLHPAILTDEGLGPALVDLVERAPVAVELEAVPQDRAAAASESAAYYVVAEGVTNAARHASASRVVVSVAVEGDELAVEVGDDGVGGADLERGTGLRGLADRVEALGGSLRLESPPGVGTRLSARLPLAPQVGEAQLGPTGPDVARR